MAAKQHAALFLVCWWLLSVAAALDLSLPVEHAIGDDAFSPAGQLTGVIQPKASSSTVHIHRSSLSAAQQEQLRAAAQDAGYYRVRVGSPSGLHLVTSVPARCLVGAGGQERLTAAITPGGELLGISYDLSQMSCDPAQHTTAGKEVSLSESVPVLVSLPVAAPQIQKELLPPTEVKRGAMAAASQPAGQPGAEPAEGEGKAPPPPDNRTFLQKYWIYGIPIVMMLMNNFAGGGARGQQGAAPAQGAGQRQRRAAQ